MLPTVLTFSYELILRTCAVKYCKFGNCREGSIFAKILRMRSFVKLKLSRNGEITLSFTDVVANFEHGIYVF